MGTEIGSHPTRPRKKKIFSSLLVWRQATFNERVSLNIEYWISKLVLIYIVIGTEFETQI